MQLGVADAAHCYFSFHYSAVAAAAATTTANSCWCGCWSQTTTLDATVGYLASRIAARSINCYCRPAPDVALLLAYFCSNLPNLMPSSALETANVGPTKS